MCGHFTLLKWYCLYYTHIPCVVKAYGEISQNAPMVFMQKYRGRSMAPPSGRVGEDVNCWLAAKPHTFPRGEGGPAQAGSEEEWRRSSFLYALRKDYKMWNIVPSLLSAYKQFTYRRSSSVSLAACQLPPGLSVRWSKATYGHLVPCAEAIAPAALKETLIKSSAADSGSFDPTFQFVKLEIHPVFLRFPNFNLDQNLSLTTLADLIIASLRR